MDDFSSKLGMIKCSEIKHFSMKFPSEGVFGIVTLLEINWKPQARCFKPKGARKQENVKSATFCATYCMIYVKLWFTPFFGYLFSPRDNLRN